MRLTDFDKTLLLLICILTILVGGTAAVLEWLSVLDGDYALWVQLMAVGWWIGANMVFVYDRYFKRGNGAKV